MPPQGHDPPLHRVAGGAAAGVVPLLVGQQAPAGVAVRPAEAQIGPPLREPGPGVAVGGAVHRVLQNLPQARRGEGLSLPVDHPDVRQGGGQAGEALPGQKQAEDLPRRPPFGGLGDEAAGGAGPAVHNHLRRPLGPEAGGGHAPQPPPRPGQQAHVVPYPLGDGLPLQLGEHAGDVHHGLAHGGGCVELLPDAEEAHPPALQPPDQIGEVPHAAAHPIQAVAHQGLRPLPADVLQHPAELGPLEIPAGKALVLVDGDLLRPHVRILGRQTAAAQLHLVFHRLPPVSEHRFAAVDGKAHGFHPRFPCVRGEGWEVAGVVGAPSRRAPQAGPPRPTRVGAHSVRPPHRHRRKNPS